MYSITTTKAIVLKSYDSGEKDSTISLFTKDLGQIYAKVSGVRDLNSKHRYAIQDYSFIEVSLVQGKTGWRITNSNFLHSFYFDFENENKREIVLKILTLVKRFYLGGDPNEKIFEDLINGFQKIQLANSYDLEKVEAEVVLDFLSDLGYVEFNHRSMSLNELRKAINEAIAVSSL